MVSALYSAVTKLNGTRAVVESVPAQHRELESEKRHWAGLRRELHN